MANLQTIRTVGVLGHVGNKNLGDEALVAAVIQNVKRRYADAEIRGFTINPEDTRQRHGIRAFPIQKEANRHRRPEAPPDGRTETQASQTESRLMVGIKAASKKVPLLYAFLKGIQKTLQFLRGSIEEARFLYQSYRNLKGTELLIVAGSQQLSDYFGGAWGFPYTLFKWSILARVTGTKVAFVSVGAGPLKSRLSRLFVNCSIRLASYRSYRDQESKKLIEEIGITGENPVFPDLVYSLKIAEPQSKSPAPPHSPPIVAINPMP